MSRKYQYFSSPVEGCVWAREQGSAPIARLAYIRFDRSGEIDSRWLRRQRDATWLKSDRAGSIAHVRRGPGQAPMELQELWDRAFDPTGSAGGDENGDVTRLHAALASRAVAEAPAGSFAQWIHESDTLARDRAYTEPALLATQALAEAPPMTPTYMTMLRSIAERRVIAAGIRMGATLQGLR